MKSNFCHFELDFGVPAVFVMKQIHNADYNQFYMVLNIRW